METLRGQRALVTGAGKRIGRALALALAENGCDIIAHYNSSQAGAEELVRELARTGRRAKAIQADFSKPRVTEALAKEALSFLGGLDILINSASVFPNPESLSAAHDITQESEESWEENLAVNAKAPFFLIQHLSKALQDSGHGNVLNIVDTSITIPTISRAAYSISKSALAAITRLAARTFAGTIRVNALELGAILPNEKMNKEEASELEWGSVNDVTSAMLFVLNTPFINGEIVRVSGNELL